MNKQIYERGPLCTGVLLTDAMTNHAIANRILDRANKMLKTYTKNTVGASFFVALNGVNQGTFRAKSHPKNMKDAVKNFSVGMFEMGLQIGERRNEIETVGVLGYQLGGKIYISLDTNKLDKILDHLDDLANPALIREPPSQQLPTLTETAQFTFMILIMYVLYQWMC